MTTNNEAPGTPGLEPCWGPGPKTAVGTAIGNKSNVWFSASHGILNEVYYPRVDTAAILDMGFIVTDGKDYFSEEKQACRSEVKWLEAGVPAFSLTNMASDGAYKIEKQIITDPDRNSLVQFSRFTPLNGRDDYSLYVLLAPHLANKGSDNTAWIEESDGSYILFAEREDCALALVCSLPLEQASAGYVGKSDGWQDLNQHKQLSWHYDRAENGNVALVAKIDLTSLSEFSLALGFGKDAKEAASNAKGSLDCGFEQLKTNFMNGWRDWHQASAEPFPLSDFALNSLAVLKIHQSKNPEGGIIAGLASPWGYSRGDDSPIGYHIVWTRDMVEVAGGLLAVGRYDDVREMIGFLQSTQRDDGHWPQNMWLDGTPYWNGVQMDETALPILLINLAYRIKAIDDGDVIDFWPMIKKAAGYLVRNGPVTQQDRWEEDPGYTPFTLAAEIAALLAAADFADFNSETAVGSYLRETADNWHDGLDRWLYSANTDWAKQLDVAGYYERITPVDTTNSDKLFRNMVHVKNVPANKTIVKVTHLVSPDALALVRFGLKRADDQRIKDTIKVIDKLLRIETPFGTTWHRYNDDGYGEHEDGSAFDGTGVGRGWPLLTAERAHYELASGNITEARNLLVATEKFANESSLLPEQVWDSPDILGYELSLGRPSGSAMPLAWAHAEYLKLVRSLTDGHIFDLPPQTVKRYLTDKVVSPHRSWRYNHKLRGISQGKYLRVETLTPAKVHWTSDNWQTINDNVTNDSGLGVYYVDLNTAHLTVGDKVIFSFYWEHSEHWEGQDFTVTIQS